MSAVVNLALVTQSQPTSLENIEFYQVLAAISVALRAASRQHFVTFLCLVLGAIENYQVQTSSLGNDIIYEVYNALLDASFSHFHPEFVPICLAVLGENLTLQDKYQRTCLLLDAFRNLAKFLKNSPQNKTKDEDLLFVVALLKLDDGLAESLLPSIFQHLKHLLDEVGTLSMIGNPIFKKPVIKSVTQYQVTGTLALGPFHYFSFNDSTDTNTKLAIIF